MEHDQSSYFCRGPDEFCWGPAPVGPTLVAGPQLHVAFYAAQGYRI